MTSHFRRGNQNASKLNPEQVIEIRRKYNDEGRTQGSLAIEYGMGVSAIGRIVRGESWHQARLFPQRVITDEEIAASQARLLAMLAVDPPPGVGQATPSAPAAPTPANAAGTGALPAPLDAATQRAIDEVARRYGLRVDAPK
jgi:hypothetical protein